MKDLRERCKNVFDNCMGLDVPGGQEWKQIESFAREIRNEALEESRVARDIAWNYFQQIITEVKDVQTPNNLIAIKVNNLAVDGQEALALAVVASDQKEVDKD